MHGHQPQWAYKNWISHLLNRVNTITKCEERCTKAHHRHSAQHRVAYKNEPTILAWDVINEPTLTANFDRNRNVAVGTTLTTWINDMIGHIRRLQAKQLVFVGDVRCSISYPALLESVCRLGSATMPSRGFRMALSTLASAGITQGPMCAGAQL